MATEQRGLGFRVAIAIGIAVIFAAILLEVIATRRVHRTPSDVGLDHIARMDQALASGNRGAAIRAWQEAYHAALGSRAWRDMIRAGDAYLRISASAGLSVATEAKAREAYLVALIRARESGSIEGVLEAAQRFDALGDRAVAAQSITIAGRLAARTKDTAATDRVRLFAEHLQGRLVEVQVP